MVASADSSVCHFSSQYNIEVDENRVMFRKQGGSRYEFQRGNLVINDQQIKLAPGQQDSVTGIYETTRQLIPKLADIAAEAAELAKLADTVYRNVNIALANEFAVFSETIGVDVHGVIAAANSLPMSHIHQPGIAVGGHCIPVYPKFYLSNDPSAGVPAVAIEVNEAMPRHAVDTILVKELANLGGALADAGE